MAILSTESGSNKKNVTEEVLKSENLIESEKMPQISTTRDLLKRAQEAANQKFAQTINNKSKTENYTSKRVLKGEESPAWHGQLIKIKLKRPPEPTRKKTKPAATSLTNKSTAPASKSLLEYYKSIRAEYEDFREIEAVRLQKRLEKFTEFPSDSKSSFEEYEREIVPWQEDSTAKSCYLCSNDFTLINRRHHCRLCGRIICNEAGCIEKIPIKLENGLVKELKSCTKCHKCLFKKSFFANQKISSTEEQMNSLFRKIKSLKEQLLETIPRFNEYLLQESITEARPLKEWRQDAWTLRDTLILYSVHLRSTVQELTELAESEALDKPVFRVFANNLRRAGNEFLQKHMFTLQILDLTKESAEIERKKESNEPSVEGSDGLKGQVKKLFPSLLNELFKMSSSSDPSFLLEFYTDEGDLIPFKDSERIREALNNKEHVLKEQLIQLERELGTDEEDQETREARDGAIKQAIVDVKSELERLHKLNIR